MSYSTFSSIFIQFLHIAEIGQTPQLQDPLSRAFHKYLQLLICILVDLGWVYKLTIRERSDKQWLRFKEREWHMTFENSIFLSTMYTDIY